MTLLRAALLGAGLCAALTARAQGGAARLEAFVTAANDYRRLGLSVLDAGASVQVGVDYAHPSGFFTGASLANVGYAVDEYLSETRDYALDYYAGYAFGRRAWQLNVAVGRYAYPGFDLDYDYDQVSFSATFRNRFSYTAAYIPELYYRDYSAWFHEVGVAQPLDRDFELSLSLGSFDSDFPTLHYTYWDIGVSKILRRIGLDLRYHEASLDYVSLLGDPQGDRWVLSVSYAFPASAGRGQPGAGSSQTQSPPPAPSTR